MGVIERSDEIKTQAEAPTAVTVGTTQNTKSLEPTNDMFSHNPVACQLTIVLLVVLRERMAFTAFVRCTAVAVLLVHALVPTIAGTAGLLREG